MNFQNIPRHDKVVKRAIVPKLGALSYFDYSSIEPRLTAYFAAKLGYPEFATKLAAGVDPYTAVAQMVTGKSVLTDQERQLWKITYLSLLYGGGVRTLQLQHDITQAEARGMIRTFHSNWPAVRALQDMTAAVHERRGYIKSLGGRRLHAEEYGEHKLLNKLIQGSAADMMKQGLVNVHGWLQWHAHEAAEPLGSHMISVVHDEIQFDGPVSELAILHDEVPPLMDAFPEVSEIVPITVGHEVSTTSWADKLDYDEWRELN